VKSKDKKNGIRELKKVVFTKDSSLKAMEYSENTSKTSGFTRSTKIGLRAGDNALLVQVELIND
jgi:ribosomal protein L17